MPCLLVMLIGLLAVPAHGDPARDQRLAYGATALDAREQGEGTASHIILSVADQIDGRLETAHTLTPELPLSEAARLLGCREEKLAEPVHVEAMRDQLQQELERAQDEPVQVAQLLL